MQSNIQHQSYDVCLWVKSEDYQNSSILCCVWQLYTAIYMRMWAAYSWIRHFSLCPLALTLLVGQQEGHPACKNWVVRYWHGYLSGARCKWFAYYGPADAIATPSSLAPGVGVWVLVDKRTVISRWRGKFASSGLGDRCPCRCYRHVMFIHNRRQRIWQINGRHSSDSRDWQVVVVPGGEVCTPWLPHRHLWDVVSLLCL